MIGYRSKVSIAEMEATRLARIERKGEMTARVMRRSMKATLINLHKERQKELNAQRTVPAGPMPPKDVERYVLIAAQAAERARDHG